MSASSVGMLPGRLGDPSMSPRTDPRIDPRLITMLAPYKLDANLPPPTVDRHAASALIAKLVGRAESIVEGLYENLPNELPGDDVSTVTHVTEIIQGVDGNAIVLHVYRPGARTSARLPCTVYVHGGGMTILKAYNRVHRQWCVDLAATGMVVIGVDFRNAGGAAGPNPFPAGLNDCSSAVAWIDAHRAELGISAIVLLGESGGGNLVLATALKAKRDGRVASIDGVYAMVPYISGGYAWDDARKRAELPSLLENDGYFIECQMMDLLVATYDPTHTHAEDPLAWPYHASAADLEGLPPHVIAVNELDPLRDEGIVYSRKLARAGVSVVGRVNLGLTHAAELIARRALPDVHRAAVGDIKRFADHLQRA